MCSAVSPNPIITPRSRPIFEPRYNINKDTQLYVGVSSESISFPTARPPRSISTVVSADHRHVRLPTSAPGAICIRADSASTPRRFPGSGIPGSDVQCVLNGNLPNAFLLTGVPGNVCEEKRQLF